MSAILFIKLVGVLAFLAGFWQPAVSLPAQSAQYYKKFETVPAAKETAKKFVTNFLDMGLGAKREASQIKDIVVVMDGSGSIGSCEFQKGKRGLQYMMDLPVNNQYAAVTYSTSANVNFNFMSGAAAMRQIWDIPYPSGQTNTQDGLTKAMDLFHALLKAGKRPNAEMQVFLVTDGHSNVKSDLTIPKADLLKKMGVEIFVFAVGNYINGIDEMVDIASSPPEDHLFRVNSLDEFDKVMQLALEQVAPDKYKIMTGHYKPPC